MGQTRKSNDKVYYLMTLSICQWHVTEMWAGSTDDIVTGEKLKDSVPSCSPQISRKLAIDQNQVSVMRGQRLMAKGIIKECLRTKFLKMHLLRIHRMICVLKVFTKIRPSTRKTLFTTFTSDQQKLTTKTRPSVTTVMPLVANDKTECQ